MKRVISLMLMLMLLSGSAALAATPTPEPVEIERTPLDPPEKIHRLLDIAYQEWTTVNGKDQGKKNKYTKWFNN